MNRRDFLGTSVLGMASITARADQNPQVRTDSLPAAIQALTPMTAGIVPITDDERRARIAKAQRLMEEQKIDAIFMEGGTSSYLLRRHAMGPERAHIRRRDTRQRRDRVCLSGVRGGPGARADQAGVRRRSAHLAGRREPLHGDREDRRRTAACDTAGSGSRSASGSSSPTASAATPGMEVVDATPVTAGCRMFKSQGGDRADAARERRHARRLQGGAGHDPRGHDPGRARPGTSSLVSPALGFRGGVSVQFGSGPRCPTAARRRSGCAKATS